MLNIKNREDGGVKGELKSSKFCKFHEGKPAWARGLCKNCYDKWLKENNPDYLEKQRKNCDEWSSKNKKRKKESIANWTAKQDPDYHKIRRLRQYGMTLDDYELLSKKQDYVCAICGKPPKKNKRLHIDHDHGTGLIRGLLCFRCNFGLTYFSENSIILGKASEYLATADVRGKQLTDELRENIDNRNRIKEMEKKEFKNKLMDSHTIGEEK